MERRPCIARAGDVLREGYVLGGPLQVSNGQVSIVVMVFEDAETGECSQLQPEQIIFKHL